MGLATGSKTPKKWYAPSLQLLKCRYATRLLFFFVCLELSRGHSCNGQQLVGYRPRDTFKGVDLDPDDHALIILGKLTNPHECVPLKTAPLFIQLVCECGGACVCVVGGVQIGLCNDPCIDHPP